MDDLARRTNDCYAPPEEGGCGCNRRRPGQFYDWIAAQPMPSGRNADRDAVIAIARNSECMCISVADMSPGQLSAYYQLEAEHSPPFDLTPLSRQGHAPITGA